MTVLCHQSCDPEHDLVCLELWRSNQLVIRAALDADGRNVALWRGERSRRLVLAVRGSIR